MKENRRLLLIFSNTLNRSYNRYCSLRATNKNNSASVYLLYLTYLVYYSKEIYRFCDALWLILDSAAVTMVYFARRFVKSLQIAQSLGSQGSLILLAIIPSSLYFSLLSLSRSLSLALTLSLSHSFNQQLEGIQDERRAFIAQRYAENFIPIN